MTILTEPLPQTCPECGCGVVVHESIELEYDKQKIRVHCNGQRWEKREFLCGGSYQWIPNFGKPEQKAICKETEAYRKKAQELADIQCRIREFEKNLLLLRQQARDMASSQSPI